MTTSIELFLDRFTQLLVKEREADVERTALLFTNCSRKLLENKGLALSSLSVANISIGLGGKRRVLNHKFNSALQ
jgi:DNA polymerase alpha-associated DNA helicase A